MLPDLQEQHAGESTRDRPARARTATVLRAVATDRSMTVITVITSMVLIVGAWWLWTTHGHVSGYIFPGPVSVAKSLWYGITDPIPSANLLHEFGITLEAAMVGLVVGAAAGVVIGALSAQFALAERLFMPYVFGVQTMPKVALAPLIFIWFGFGQMPKEIMAGLLAFFPVVVNTHAGMNLIDREARDLFTALRASRFQEMVKLRLPTALPLIFAGLEIGVVNALLGAVVSEFIAGQNGIGTTMIKLQSVSNTPGIFACLVILAVAGIVLHSIVRVIRLKVVFWIPAQHGRAK